MTTPVNADSLVRAHVTGADGEGIGDVENVFYDDQSGRPEWVRLHTGMFGKKDRFVPVAGARLDGDELVVPYTKQQIKDAPELDVDRSMSQDQEGRLRQYYSTLRSVPGQRPVRAAEQRDDRRAQAQGGQDAVLTRAEERLVVQTQDAEAGTVRLRKFVDTVPFEQKVSTYREEYEVVKEPIEQMAGGTEQPELAEDSAELILHEERVAVSKQVVPVERVRLQAKRVNQEKVVRDTLRRERIEVEAPTPNGDRPNPDRA